MPLQAFSRIYFLISSHKPTTYWTKPLKIKLSYALEGLILVVITENFMLIKKKPKTTTHLIIVSKMQILADEALSLSPDEQLLACDLH